MTFEQAIENLKKSKTVRRSSFPSNTCLIKLYGDRIAFYNFRSKKIVDGYSLIFNDFESDDWEIVSEESIPQPDCNCRMSCRGGKVYEQICPFFQCQSNYSASKNVISDAAPIISKDGSSVFSL